MASDNISFAPTGIESQTPAPTVFACEKKEHFISLLYLTGGRRCPFRAHTRSTKALLNLAQMARQDQGDYPEAQELKSTLERPDVDKGLVCFFD